MIVLEHGQLLERRAAGAEQHDRIRGIIEFEAAKRDSDKLAIKTDEVSDCENGEDRSIVATEDEVVDPADILPLVVDDSSELQRFGPIALCDFLGVRRDEAHL